MFDNDTCTTCTTPPNLRPAALAERWGTTPATLANMRHQGKGPAYWKRGTSVMYAMRDVLDWERAHRVSAGAAA